MIYKTKPPIRRSFLVVTVMNRSFCLEGLALYHWIEVALIPLIPAAVTCVLVIIQFVRQSLQMRRATKQWHLNRYMNLLSRENIIYFLVYVSFNPARPRKTNDRLDDIL